MGASLAVRAGAGLAWALAISLLAISTLAWASGGGNCDFEFVIYGDPLCPHCEATLETLTSLYGKDRVVFCDVRHSATCRPLFENIVTDAYGGYEAVPVVAVVCNGTLSALVLGEISPRALQNLSALNGLLRPNNSTAVTAYVVANGGLVPVSTVSGPSQSYLLARYVPGYGQPGQAPPPPAQPPPADLAGLASAAVVLALLDSANPCELALLFGLTVSALSGKKKSLGPPLLFVAIVFAGYTLLGLGLYSAVRAVPAWIFGALAVALGAYNVWGAARRGSPPGSGLKCALCERLGLSPSAGYATAALLAALSVTVLLPCTSGPYLVFAALLRRAAPATALIMLVAYNLIFVAPMLAVVALARSAARQKRVARWLARNSRALEAFIGLALVAAGLYVVFVG